MVVTPQRIGGPPRDAQKPIAPQRLTRRTARCPRAETRLCRFVEDAARAWVGTSSASAVRLTPTPERHAPRERPTAASRRLRARDDPDDEALLDDEFPLGDGVADTAGFVYCPYCGEENEVSLDPGGGPVQAYVETATSAAARGRSSSATSPTAARS
jgi:hypothetical protein